MCWALTGVNFYHKMAGAWNWYWAVGMLRYYIYTIEVTSSAYTECGTGWIGFFPS